jgi:hypothetical protein
VNYPEDRIACQRLIARAFGHFTELNRMLCESPERMYDMAGASSTRDTLPCLSRAIRLARLGAVAFFLAACGGEPFAASNGLAPLEPDSGAAGAATESGSGGATAVEDAGAPGSGGTPQGGAPGAGGSPSSGGSGTGGIVSAGGALGSTGGGIVSGTGGAPSAGGNQGAGGYQGTGGTTTIDLSTVLANHPDCVHYAIACHEGSQTGEIVQCANQGTSLQANVCILQFGSQMGLGVWCCVQP